MSFAEVAFGFGLDLVQDRAREHRLEFQKVMYHRQRHATVSFL
jgi:hypothetical protein